MGHQSTVKRGGKISKKKKKRKQGNISKEINSKDKYINKQSHRCVATSIPQIAFAPSKQKKSMKKMKYAKKNNSSLLFLFVFYCFCFLSPLLLLIYKTKGLARSDNNCDYASYLAICLWLWCSCCCCFRFLYCCWAVFTISDFYFKISMQRHFFINR